MLTQSAEYALRAVVHLGMLDSSTHASASDISAATKVPLPYLQKILRMLTRHGILTAQRGAGGGFLLAKLPGAISVMDVLRATDSPLQRIERCPLGIKGHTKLCPLHHLIDEQIAGVERVFATTTIRDLLESGSDILPLCEGLGQSLTPINISGNPEKS